MKSTSLLLKLALIFFCTLQNHVLIKGATIAQDQIPKKQTTNVVNVKNCDKCVWPHERMKDVQTYAELKRDRKASLPDTFSFCFDSMTTHDANQIFFVLLGKDSNTWLPLGISRDDIYPRQVYLLL